MTTPSGALDGEVAGGGPTAGTAYTAAGVMLAQHTFSLMTKAAFPLIFAGFLTFTGSFVPGFLAAAALPILLGLLLLRPRPLAPG